LLCSLFRTYSVGLTALAVVPPMLPVRQQPGWATILELALAGLLAAMAFKFAA
jgi:hypothetical protein